ncbi:hypothetical protein APUTEX25_004795, partial [Auxenochlorella protothecoides]
AFTGMGRVGGRAPLQGRGAGPRARNPLVVQAAGNTFGHSFRVTTFGESHGGGVGCVEAIQYELDRRRPGQSRITTPRKESDTAEILSGLAADRQTTLGTPICVLVRNADQRSGDYAEMEAAYRPSHADATYDFKYGIRAVAGGGRSSARETIGRVAAGAIAKKLLHEVAGTEILAYVSRVRDVEAVVDQETMTHEQIESTPVRCPDPDSAGRMYAAIDEVRTRGESCGGEVTCVVRRCPKGLGQPVFGKLEAELAAALMSLPASKVRARGGWEIGSGFSGSRMLGSEHNDAFYMAPDGSVRTRTNRSGGVQGGISNGEDAVLRLAFKPTATITARQDTVNRSGEDIQLAARGRHDPCVVPRAVPMVEAMVALVLADALLQHYGQCELLPRSSAAGADVPSHTQFSHAG